MYSVSFELETITPLFMAGADGKTPELRPPSFKGMMRFWWRAMRAENNIKTLAKDEAKIFGGTGKGEGKSKISIRISYNKLNIKSYSPLPHKNTQFSIPAIDTQKFRCILNGEESYRKEVLTALKLSLLLGGFGKRSRRGFGSISYKSFNNFEELIDEIKETNIITNNSMSIDKNKSNDSRIVLSRNINLKEPQYPRIHEVYLGKNSLSSANSILKKIGQASHDYNDPALGTINPHRMASPIIATVVKINQAYCPIITKLTSHFPASLNYNINKQDDFIDGVLI